MRIRHLSVRNFRGICTLDWSVPDVGLVCLIGCGDSTKTTILEAMRRAFYPQWNLTFGDADFFKCDVSSSIEITATIGQLPDEFRDQGKYGLNLSGWSPTDSKVHPEPGEGLEDALTVRLSVDRDLEPKWTVVCADGQDVFFKPADRAAVAVHLIGDANDRHLGWARGSVLNRLTENPKVAASLAESARAAKAALDVNRAVTLAAFDSVAKQAETTARTLGVNVDAEYLAHLDADAIGVRIGGLALHDGPMPLRQLGLGSKRLLATGLVRNALSSPHITLFDEIEVGLEPHRIVRLVQHLKADASGQYFVTTHSPAALREFAISDLHVVHCDDGIVKVVAAAQPANKDALQGSVRAFAEAFLAPKIIVCEGATEEGFVRGLDNIWQQQKKASLAYCGVAWLKAAADNRIYGYARQLRSLSYEVAVLADSDGKDALSSAQTASLSQLGVTLLIWEGKAALEDRLFADLPWSAVVDASQLARKAVGADGSFVDQIKTHLKKAISPDPNSWAESDELRKGLAAAAKASGWFKKIQTSFEMAIAIAPSLTAEAIGSTPLWKNIAALRAWIDSD